MHHVCRVQRLVSTRVLRVCQWAGAPAAPHSGGINTRFWKKSSTCHKFTVTWLKPLSSRSGKRHSTVYRLKTSVRHKATQHLFTGRKSDLKSALKQTETFTQSLRMTNKSFWTFVKLPREKIWTLGLSIQSLYPGLTVGFFLLISEMFQHLGVSPPSKLERFGKTRTCLMFEGLPASNTYQSNTSGMRSKAQLQSSETGSWITRPHRSPHWKCSGAQWPPSGLEYPVQELATTWSNSGETRESLPGVWKIKQKKTKKRFPGLMKPRWNVWALIPSVVLERNTPNTYLLWYSLHCSVPHGDTYFHWHHTITIMKHQQNSSLLHFWQVPHLSKKVILAWLKTLVKAKPREAGR